jgi:hypothetical protein
MADLAKSNGNVASSSANVATSNANTATSSSTPYTSSRESSITSARDKECVRQRTAAGLDTSPCSGWASER